MLDKGDNLPDEWRVILPGPYGIKVLVVGSSLLDGNDDSGEACSHQFQIHGKARCTPVTVRKRMDDHQIGMHSGCSLHGMELHLFLTIPIKEGVHPVLHMQMIWRCMPGTGNDNVPCTITPCTVGYAAKHQLVQLLEATLIKRCSRINEGFKEADGLGMVDGFKMLTNRLATYGHAIFQYNLGLHERKRVPLNGVGMKGVPQDHVRPELAGGLCRQRTKRI